LESWEQRERRKMRPPATGIMKESPNIGERRTEVKGVRTVGEALSREKAADASSCDSDPSRALSLR